MPRGAVNLLPKKNLTSCPKFYERVEKKRRPYYNNIGHTGIIMKVARYSFSGSIPSLSINYVTINKHLEKLP